MTVYIQKWFSISDRIHMTCRYGTGHETIDDGNESLVYLFNAVTLKDQPMLAWFLLEEIDDDDKAMGILTGCRVRKWSSGAFRMII
jgi:hypothetical protein